MKSINWIGVIVALIASQALGFVWYGVVFEKVWIALSGVDPNAMSTTMPMVLGAVQNLVIALGLAWFIPKTGMTGWVNGAILGAIACGFFGWGTMALRFIYGGDNTGLIPIDGGYMLLQYLISGAVIGGLKLGKAAASA
jgi:hypothetical protein